MNRRSKVVKGLIFNLNHGTVKIKGENESRGLIKHLLEELQAALKYKPKDIKFGSGRVKLAAAERVRAFLRYKNEVKETFEGKHIFDLMHTLDQEMFALQVLRRGGADLDEETLEEVLFALASKEDIVPRFIYGYHKKSLDDSEYSEGEIVQRKIEGFQRVRKARFLKLELPLV